MQQRQRHAGQDEAQAVLLPGKGEEGRLLRTGRLPPLFPRFKGNSTGPSVGRLRKKRLQHRGPSLPIYCASESMLRPWLMRAGSKGGRGSLPACLPFAAAEEHACQPCSRRPASPAQPPPPSRCLGLVQCLQPWAQALCSPFPTAASSDMNRTRPCPSRSAGSSKRSRQQALHSQVGGGVE
ncbi:hypothetical protein ABPG75_007732 [Micractinium tetrahymenae]